eukprot:m.167047 g.167047  ORF g.167047 m.167047 type:complete len:116 (+) comp14450_c0_seq22:161-508(+)
MAGFRDNLGRVVQYCENVQDCRRVQQLAYFGEHFDAAKCRGMCDVCRQGAVYQLEDVTESAKALARLVQVCVCVTPHCTLSRFQCRCARVLSLQMHHLRALMLHTHFTFLFSLPL